MTTPADLEPPYARPIATPPPLLAAPLYVAPLAVALLLLLGAVAVRLVLLATGWSVADLAGQGIFKTTPRPILAFNGAIYPWAFWMHWANLAVSSVLLSTGLVGWCRRDRRAIACCLVGLIAAAVACALNWRVLINIAFCFTVSGGLPRGMTIWPNVGYYEPW